MTFASICDWLFILKQDDDWLLENLALQQMGTAQKIKAAVNYIFITCCYDSTEGLGNYFTIAKTVDDEMLYSI